MNDLERKREALSRSAFLMVLFTCIFLLILTTGIGVKNVLIDWVFYFAIAIKVLMCYVVAISVKSFIENLLDYLESEK